MQYLTQWQLMTEVSETAHNYPKLEFCPDIRVNNLEHTYHGSDLPATFMT